MTDRLLDIFHLSIAIVLTLALIRTASAQEQVCRRTIWSVFVFFMEYIPKQDDSVPTRGDMPSTGYDIRFDDSPRNRTRPSEYPDYYDDRIAGSGDDSDGSFRSPDHFPPDRDDSPDGDDEEASTEGPRIFSDGGEADRQPGEPMVKPLPEAGVGAVVGESERPVAEPGKQWNTQN